MHGQRSSLEGEKESLFLDVHGPVQGEGLLFSPTELQHVHIGVIRHNTEGETLLCPISVPSSPPQVIMGIIMLNAVSTIRKFMQSYTNCCHMEIKPHLVYRTVYK